MYTTSYKSEGLEGLITSLVKSVKPCKAIEFGSQQGHSAVLIAKGMVGGVVKTYDLFNDKYPQAPYKETHADLLKTLKNVEGLNIQVFAKDVFKVKPTKCDLLHIDICNHFSNVLPLLMKWENKVGKMILLEGGVYNKWQKKYGFDPFNDIFDMEFMDNWNHIVIKGEGGYALTVLTRK